MKPWFHRFSRRLEEEFRELGEAGYEYRIDKAARQTGRIVITVNYPLNGETHELVVRFPETYPYFPFEITSQSFPGGRHKDPHSGQLCLLKDPQQNWSAMNDRLAGFLKTQVAKLAEAHLRPDNAKDIEAHEASQVTGYFRYRPGAVVFTGDWEIPKTLTRGYLILGLEDGWNPNAVLRCAVLEIQDEKRNVIARLDDRLRGRYTQTAKGRWLRPSVALPFDEHEAQAHAIKAWPALANPQFDGAPDILGFLIPEEVDYERFHDNWVFMVRQKVREDGRRGQATIRGYFARSDQASLKVLQARTPNLAPIFTKKVLVVGLGSIGSAFAWQMARAGIGGIHMIDFDHVQLGNAPRWLLGWNAAGFDKAGLLANFLGTQYPFGNFKAWPHRIGSPKYSDMHHGDLDILPEALDGVDLIFDATAEWCVSNYISELARDRGIPYTWATGTPGAWGGTIGRVVPGQTAGCWRCYQHMLGDGAIQLPHHANTPNVQPVGCFHPTFTGAGFDMDHVTLAAVRLAVSTLCSGADQGYPDFDWDVGVVNIWSDLGAPIAPSWKTYKLDKHPECRDHERR